MEPGCRGPQQGFIIEERHPLVIIRRFIHKLMALTEQIAKHFRDVYSGDHRTAVSL
jgi:hypothetical protein